MTDGARQLAGVGRLAMMAVALAFSGFQLTVAAFSPISSQVTRNRVRNLDDARSRLAALIVKALVEPKTRRKTKPSRAAKRRRVDDKRRNSDKKQSRGKVDY